MEGNEGARPLSKPRLAIVAPFSTRAALGFRIFNIARKLNPEVVIFHSQDRYGKSERLYPQQKNLWWKKSLWLLLVHRFQIMKWAWNCDTVYFFKPLPLNFCAAWPLKLLGKKVVFDYDEWEPYTQEEYVKGKGLRNAIVVGALGLISNLCASIACCITTSNRRINDEILHKEKCLLIPNGVDYEEYATDNGKPRGFELKKEVAYAGSLHYASLLLPFLLQVPKGFKLHIYGEGGAKEEIGHSLKQRGVDYVFHGYVQPDELSRELKRFRGIFLAPYLPLRNIAYSSSGKMPQYMALGQPVIVSDVEGPTDFLAGKDCAYPVEAGQERNIGKLIESIYADKKGAERKAKMAQQVVKDKFDWRKMCEELGKFMEEC